MDVIKALVASRSAGVTVDQLGFTPVMVCALFGQADALTALVTAADGMADGKTTTREDVLQLRAQEPARGATALHLAVLRQDAVMVSTLLAVLAATDDDAEACAQVLGCRLASPSGATALHLACVAADADTQQQLCEALVSAAAGRADVIEAATSNGFTALRAAAALGRRPVVDLLLGIGGAVVRS